MLFHFPKKCFPCAVTRRRYRRKERYVDLSDIHLFFLFSFFILFFFFFFIIGPVIFYFKVAMAKKFLLIPIIEIFLKKKSKHPLHK